MDNKKELDLNDLEEVSGGVYQYLGTKIYIERDYNKLVQNQEVAVYSKEGVSILTRIGNGFFISNDGINAIVEYGDGEIRAGDLLHLTAKYVIGPLE